ncbi:MAG: hypothetical protein P1P84_02135 [Deferrisomatales bacterium]|nr:hypothetical protein [Deferrisomatales bacterium]
MKKLSTLLALLIAAPVAFIGCSDNSTDLGAAASAKPTFTAFGTVTDPGAVKLAGVKVGLYIGGSVKEATTDANGLFSIKNVPFDSDVKLTMSYTKPAVKDDPKTEADETAAAVPFFPVELMFRTIADKGIGNGDQATYQANLQFNLSQLLCQNEIEVYDDVPWMSFQSDYAEYYDYGPWTYFDFVWGGSEGCSMSRDLVMVPADQTIEGQVFAEEFGPAVGATVIVDARASGYPLFQSTVVDADGNFSFTGLPRSGLLNPIDFDFWVMPYDADGDGFADYSAGYGWDYDPFWDQPDMLKFELNWANGISMVHSNVDDRTHEADAPIFVWFDQVISPIEVTLYDQTYGRFVAVTATVEAGCKLIVTPVDGPLAASTYYRLNYNVGAANGNTTSSNLYFNIYGAGEVAAVTGLALQDPDDTFDAGDDCFDIQWASDPNAAEYCIYATNGTTAPEWNLVECDTFSGGHADPTVLVQYAEACVDYRKFDTFHGDEEKTFLDGGTQITFVVTGVNEDGMEGPFDGADTLTVADTEINNTASGVYYGGQSTSANNTGDPAAQMVELYVYGFGEYMDRATAPTITFTDGADTNTTVPAATWVWSNDATYGWFEFTVAADTTHAGDTFVIDLTGVADTTGNAIANLPAPPAIPPATTDDVNEARLPNTVADPATFNTLF